MGNAIVRKTTIAFNKEEHEAIVLFRERVRDRLPPGVNYTTGKLLEILVSSYGESAIEDLAALHGAAGEDK